MLNAPLVSFMPAVLVPDLIQLRTDLGLANMTCVIPMELGQLPYAYLEPRVRAMLLELRQIQKNVYGHPYPNWNWESPEMTNSQYVLLQSGKLMVMDAVRQVM